MDTIAGNLAFPRDKAGMMGLLIMFTDSWQAAGGETAISVYHPREPSPGSVLVDVRRDGQLLAQFDVPLQHVQKDSLMALLPQEWRKGR